MSNFTITVFIDSGEPVILHTNYPKEYDLKTDVINIGRNGLMHKIEEKHIYYPPHKITKIEVEPGSPT